MAASGMIPSPGDDRNEREAAGDGPGDLCLLGTHLDDGNQMIPVSPRAPGDGIGLFQDPKSTRHMASELGQRS